MAQYLNVASRMVGKLQPRQCKYCGSHNVVRFGHYLSIQRLFCNDCQHKFVDSEASPGMKTAANQIALALIMYYDGVSLNRICRQLTQQYDNFVSDSTVYEWISAFSKKAMCETRDHRPNAGDIWVADVRLEWIHSKNVLIWDIIDVQTRFLLASHMSLTRASADAKLLMEKACERARKTPQVVLTDKLQACWTSIELAFGGDTKHIAGIGLTTEANIDLVERWRSLLKDRSKVMKRLKKHVAAEAILGGWLVYYNYLRPQESLGGKTPAEMAGIKFPHKNWLHIVQAPKGGISTVSSQVEDVPSLLTPIKSL